MQACVPSMALPSAASRGASGKQCVVRSVDEGEEPPAWQALCWVWQGTREKVSRAHISVNQHSGGATPKGCEATESICKGSPSFTERT